MSNNRGSLMAFCVIQELHQINEKSSSKFYFWEGGLNSFWVESSSIKLFWPEVDKSWSWIRLLRLGYKRKRFWMKRSIAKDLNHSICRKEVVWIKLITCVEKRGRANNLTLANEENYSCISECNLEKEVGLQFCVCIKVGYAIVSKLGCCYKM